MYTIVTGAAGFIGANIVKGLNERGIDEIIAVDNLKHADKFRNLVDCEIADYLDKQEFIEMLDEGHFDGCIDAVLHEGACSDTMETDGRYMMENNYRYSAALLDHCLDQEVPFLYASSASVYGGGSEFRESRECEAPLNVYAYSKFLFDQLVRRRLPDASSPVVDQQHSGIFNLGSGRAQSFNDVAVATVNACRAAQGEAALPLSELQSRGIIEYIPFPDALRGKYQSFTQADLSNLRAAGYRDDFATVEQGVGQYVKDLLQS